MKRVLIVLGGLVGLVAAVAVIGLFIPREHMASSQVLLAQPPDSVWVAIRDFENIPAWWPETKSVRRLPDAGGHEVWEQTLGDGYAMTLEVAEETRPTRLHTVIVGPPDSPFGGSWTYELALERDGTRVTVTENGWISNLIFRSVARAIGYHRTLDGYLVALGKRFGESVTPVHVGP